MYKPLCFTHIFQEKLSVKLNADVLLYNTVLPLKYPLVNPNAESLVVIKLPVIFPVNPFPYLSAMELVTLSFVYSVDLSPCSILYPHAYT